MNTKQNKNLYIDNMSIKNWKGSECIELYKKFKFKNATNISIVIDKNILPLSIHTISGNTHDSSNQFVKVIFKIIILEINYTKIMVLN